MSGVTIVVQDKGSEHTRDLVIVSSRKLYAKHVKGELTSKPHGSDAAKRTVDSGIIDKKKRAKPVELESLQEIHTILK